MFENSPKLENVQEQTVDSEWTEIRESIIAEGLYKQKGVTVEDVARRFAKNRTYVSNMVI